MKGSPTRVVKIFSPKLTREGIVRKFDDAGRAVGELLDFLTDRKAI
ncbi:MAG TPA: hypothetical protein VMW83_00025 [Spirochaetia bacterium]|nr:hypothetical protein [Spirochaetia bacterium]